MRLTPLLLPCVNLCETFLQRDILAGPLERLHGLPLGLADGVEVDLGDEPVLMAQAPLDRADRDILVVMGLVCDRFLTNIWMPKEKRHGSRGPPMPGKRLNHET